MKPHLIMPMGGAGSRFYKNGITKPKPLIEISGKPFLYWSVLSVTNFVNVRDIIFVVLKQHMKENRIDDVIYSFFPDAEIIVLDQMLAGPVFTSLRGAEGICDDAPVIFNDCDHMFRFDSLNMVIQKELPDLDGILLTFLSDQPQFSYISYNSKGKIIGTVEKQAVSTHAVCGAYIFKTADIFRNAAEEYIGHCPYDECYMSGIYNVLCSHGMTVKDYLLDVHVAFGTPQEYEKSRSSAYFAQMMAIHNRKE